MHGNWSTSMQETAIPICYLRHEEAHILGSQALEVQKRLLGEEHPDTLRSMHNLAYTNTYLGEHVQAKSLQKRVLEIQKRVLGEGHPDVLASMVNLA